MDPLEFESEKKICPVSRGREIGRTRCSKVSTGRPERVLLRPPVEDKESGKDDLASVSWSGILPGRGTHGLLYGETPDWHHVKKKEREKVRSPKMC